MTNKEFKINIRHGILRTPIFFPTIGWPGGRGEYDFLFKNLKYFCEKIDHYNFLFNFSSFIFGFTIPKNDFFTQYSTFIGKDIRKILIENTAIDKDTANKLIILLDCGGNRIFNKIIFDGLDPIDLRSYKLYLEAYKKFIKDGNADIFVNFDIGPSYTTRDSISIKGSEVWNCLSNNSKNTLNHNLLKESINFKGSNDSIMVPINATNIENIKNNLNYLYENYKNDVDIIGIAGIANSSLKEIKLALEEFNKFRSEKNWNFFLHGLGLGGFANIPLLIKYDVDSCDVATPWRRACTNRVSEPYFPLIGNNLEFQNIDNPFAHTNLYDDIYSNINCNCPFCLDIPLNEVRSRCINADKDHSQSGAHEEDFREMRIRVFFHNVFQHIGFLKVLQNYKNKYKENFLEEFIKNMPNSKFKKILENPSYLE